MSQGDILLSISAAAFFIEALCIFLLDLNDRLRWWPRGAAARIITFMLALLTLWVAYALILFFSYIPGRLTQ